MEGLLRNLNGLCWLARVQFQWHIMWRGGIQSVLKNNVKHCAKNVLKKTREFPRAGLPQQHRYAARAPRWHNRYHLVTSHATNIWGAQRGSFADNFIKKRNVFSVSLYQIQYVSHNDDTYVTTKTISWLNQTLFGITVLTKRCIYRGDLALGYWTDWTDCQLVTTRSLGLDANLNRCS